MALTNLTKIVKKHYGISSWGLIDDDGDVVVAFEYYASAIAKNGKAHDTRERYAQVVAKFIDYLYECGAFSDSITQTKLNTVIDIYPTILARGKDYDWDEFARESENELLGTDYSWIPAVVRALDIPPKGLAPNSFTNTLAPLNGFLNLCETFRQEQHEKAMHLGATELPSQLAPLIKAISGIKKLSSSEVKSMKHASVLGAVIRFDGKAMTRPAGLEAPDTPNMPVGFEDQKRLDFPITKVGKLIAASKSHRDCVLWLLQCGAGLRSSEVLNLRWGDIDIQEQKIWVSDPRGLRYGDQMTKAEKVRFKGRKYSMTYIIAHLRDKLFEELELYLKLEYAGISRNQDFVFQYLKGKKRGKPYVGVSDSGYINSFKRCVARAGIKTPKGLGKFSWTPHSLRHAYAVYMINYIQIKGQKTPGLELEEVQMLMGHKKISTTAHYARKKRDMLLAKLEAADRALFEYQAKGALNNIFAEESIDFFPPALAERIEASL